MNSAGFTLIITGFARSPTQPQAVHEHVAEIGINVANSLIALFGTDHLPVQSVYVRCMSLKDATRD